MMAFLLVVLRELMIVRSDQERRTKECLWQLAQEAEDLSVGLEAQRPIAKVRTNCTSIDIFPPMKIQRVDDEHLA